MQRPRRAVCAFFLIANFLSATLVSAQRLTWYERLLLLQDPRKVTGVVVDEAGKPVAGAHIDNSDVQPREQLFTDDRGRFELDTRAPAMIIRKLGFNGELVKLNHPGPLRVVLHRATAAIPACSAACRTLKSSAAEFCFPEISGVSISDEGREEDTVVRGFTIPGPSRVTELLHGAGPAWSLGVPYTGDVWESSKYSERGFTGKASDIIDARGIAPDGSRWRYLGRFGESASYYEADSRNALILDRVLDGVCLTKN